MRLVVVYEMCVRNGDKLSGLSTSVVTCIMFVKISEVYKQLRMCHLIIPVLYSYMQSQ